MNIDDIYNYNGEVIDEIMSITEKKFNTKGSILKSNIIFTVTPKGVVMELIINCTWNVYEDKYLDKFRIEYIDDDMEQKEEFDKLLVKLQCEVLE